MMNSDATAMTIMLPRFAGRTVELVRVDRSTPSGVGRALERAGARVTAHDLPSGSVCPPVLSGDVVLLCAATFTMATQLLLTELRLVTEACLTVVTSGITVEHRILARMHGADHLLDVDIDERELTALLHNEFRRHAARAVAPRVAEIEHRWGLDLQGWRLVAPNGRTVRLSKSEYGVMRLLLGAAGRVQSRVALRAVIQGDVERGRVLDVLISRIRRKVWDCAQMELPVRSARAEGYVFAGIARIDDL